MDPIESFTLQNSGSERPGALTLGYSGQTIDLAHRGALLDAQFCTNDGRFVIFTSDAVASESSLYISLLSHELLDMEHVELSQEYTDGTLRRLRSASSDSLVFEFFSGVTHQLFYSSQGKFEFVSGSEVRYSKSFFSRKHLVAKRASNGG